MQKQVLVLLFITVVIFTTKAFPINFNVTVSSFQDAENKPYIEVYYIVDRNSLSYTYNEQNKLNANVSTSLFIFDMDSNLVYGDRYNLLSPTANDSSSIKDFIDIQRIPITYGDYFLELELSDKLNPENTKTKVTPFYIENLESTCFSSIQLLEKSTKTVEKNQLSKSGFDIVPIISSNYYYPEEKKTLEFYTEIYNTKTELGKKSDLIILYYIESKGKNVPINNYSSFRKDKAQDIIPVLSSFNIENLPSGNYNLTIEVKNRKLELIRKKSLFFQRNNPIANIDLENVLSIDITNTFSSNLLDINELSDYINALYPISARSERRYQENQLNMKNLEFMQQYFYSFWKNRDYLNPEKAWLNYLEKLKYVDEKFSTTIHKGYETDRGRVYLEYGAANAIDARINDPNDFPYEIWQYYRFKR